MRALILLLSLAVIGLAASIVLEAHGREPYERRAGPRFEVGRLIADARPGEQAVYREQGSLELTAFVVEAAPPPAPNAVPRKVIRRELRDRAGQPLSGRLSHVTYPHDPSLHGWFPLEAPEAPDALDRVWIVRAIRPDTVRLGGKERRCWRVDLTDPALPPDQDTVVAWFDPEVPVYGLLRYKRLGETWDLVHAQGGGA